MQTRVRNGSDVACNRNDVVVGICAEGKEQFFDLVIDASGMRSPFRAQVPNKFEIQSKPGKDDVMYGYRAFSREWRE